MVGGKGVADSSEDVCLYLQNCIMFQKKVTPIITALGASNITEFRLVDDL
jgi:hypothetical protein